MPNRYIESRLSAIQQMLRSIHAASSSMSSSSKGNEREAFVHAFLSEVLPPTYRFGTGDITSTNGARSGQLDVVVEYPTGPSLPTSPTSPRLYLAESVAAVIEVKSNLSGQWKEVKGTAHALSKVHRNFDRLLTIGGGALAPQIPFFAVGYTGWTQMDTLKSHVDADPAILGALVIDAGLFYCKGQDGCEAGGPWSLWGLVCSLHALINSLHAGSLHPVRYAL